MSIQVLSIETLSIFWLALHTQVARLFQVLKGKMQKMKIFLSTAFERVFWGGEPFLPTFADFK